MLENWRVLWQFLRIAADLADLADFAILLKT